MSTATQSSPTFIELPGGAGVVRLDLIAHTRLADHHFGGASNRFHAAVECTDGEVFYGKRRETQEEAEADLAELNRAILSATVPADGTSSSRPDSPPDSPPSLWLLQSPPGYYIESAIVRAASEEEAQHTHPSRAIFGVAWDTRWTYDAPMIWPPPSQVSAVRICNRADSRLTPGVISTRDHLLPTARGSATPSPEATQSKGVRSGGSGTLG